MLSAFPHILSVPRVSLCLCAWFPGTRPMTPMPFKVYPAGGQGLFSGPDILRAMLSATS